MKQVAVITLLLTVVASGCGQQFSELLPGDPTRQMAVEAVRSWISGWEHPDAQTIAGSIDDDVLAIKSDRYISVGGGWYSAQVSLDGTVIQFTLRPLPVLPVVGRPLDGSEAKRLAETLLLRRKIGDWQYRIYSERHKSGKYRFSIHLALSKFPNVYSGLDYSHSLEIDSASGYVTHFDLPAAPAGSPVDPAQVRIRFSSEDLRARAFAAYGAFRPFPQAVSGHAGFVFRVPKFSNFTHWMTHAHHSAAGTNRRLAMYQLNVFSAEPDMPQQIIWIDAETGNLIAIREVKLHFTGGSDKSGPTLLRSTNEVFFAVRARDGSIRVGIRAANGVLVSGTYNENRKEFRPSGGKASAFKPSNKQVGQIRTLLKVPTMPSSK